jgi:hypothetical protein
VIPWKRLRPLAAPIAIAISLAALAWYAHSSGVRSGTAATQARWDAEKVRTLEAQGEQILLAQIREGELTAQMDQLTRTYHRDKNRIASEHADLVDSLRQRPDRPSDGGLPEAATAGSGPPAWCDGSQLWRPDGEFLAREAARADELRAALGVCSSAYNALTR